MASLFLNGNLNQHTFANAALAAHVRDRDGGNDGLTDVFVLHSPESEKHLREEVDWKRHLVSHGLNPEEFLNVTVNLQPGSDVQLDLVARRIEGFLATLNDREDIYVDLTNGTSFYKSVLSTIGYVLGVRRQFILDLKPPVLPAFLEPDDLRAAYLELPDPSLLDSVARAWLTETRRFKAIARSAAETFAAICGDAARNGLEQDIRHAVDSRLKGEKHKDGAVLGSSVRSVGRAFEELIRGAYEAILLDGSKRYTTPNDVLDQVRSYLETVAPQYEPQLLDEVSRLLRHLRNAATHERTSPEFGGIRARVSTELLLATVEYLKILHQDGLLRPTISSATEMSGSVIHGIPGQVYFFGLDGDDTGRELERMFQENRDSRSFARFSKAVDAAIKEVSKMLRSAPINGEVIFSSGDDILFKGYYDAHAIENLRSTYARLSGRHTCSVGFGKTPREAYVALKMAKATPKKDSVVGVVLAGLEEIRPLTRPSQGTSAKNSAEQQG